MNHQINNALISKSPKNDYQTRFLLESGAAKNKNAAPTPHHPRQQKSSTMIKRIGGMAIFDFLVITLSERISEEHPVLAAVYGRTNLKKLIQLQKELLLFAFSDNQDAFLLDGRCKTTIFRRHCELGLMNDPIFFDGLMKELLRSLRIVGTSDERIILDCASRFANMRSILQDTHEQMVHAKNNQTQRSLRAFFQRRRQHNANAA